MDYHQSMSSQLPFQVPTTFTAFASQENMFSAPPNMFGTSTMTPPSAFRGLSPMHYYRPTMPSEGSDNPSHDSPPPLPPKPNLSLSHNDLEGREEDLRVAHHHIDSFLFHLYNKKNHIYLNYLFSLFYIYHTSN